MNQNTKHKDKLHQLPAMAYKTIIECKHYLQSTRHKIQCCKSHMKRT